MRIRTILAVCAIAIVATTATAAPGARRAGVAGTVSAVATGSITVAAKGGGSQTFAVDGSTRIMVGGEKAVIGQVRQGDPVIVRYEQGENLAKAIVVPKPVVEGKITAADGNLLTVLGRDGTSCSVAVPDGAKILLQGRFPGMLSDLKAGCAVAVSGQMADGRMMAGRISFTPPSVRGVVTDVSGGAISIRTADGRTVTGNTSDRTVVIVRPRVSDSSIGKLSDVKAGAVVRMGGSLPQVLVVEVLGSKGTGP